ncbi:MULTISPECIES: hypothetical protein [unclassified Streptomyces]|uniref:hypothetical protein n=1 Tax=unclassified Streptomyces TaxID=2593676 RepID=UPI002E0E231F|nr:hypothetical protein OG457_17700 [Streptomyces sp. NBC_01207]WTA18838.1 hypothetical protein OG365_12590 [Streptomyces sp. NBC_00853]
MHTQTTPFALRAWQGGEKSERRRIEWEGKSTEWGEITVASLPQARDDVQSTEVAGAHIPEAVFESRGMHVTTTRRPTLNGATLRVGGAVVYLKRNRWGATHRGRALHMKHAGDRYRLWAVNRREYVLMREADNQDRGVTIKVKESGIAKWKRVDVSVTGRALGADIALALVFSGVDRSVLTRRGAVRAGFSRVFHVAADSALG